MGLLGIGWGHQWVWHMAHNLRILVGTVLGLVGLGKPVWANQPFQLDVQLDSAVQEDGSAIRECIACDWSNAILTGSNLNGAILKEINLTGADLRQAQLEGVVFNFATLRGADLSGSRPHFSFMWEADLRQTNFQGADLSGASLSGADLRQANLQGANLQGVDLTGAQLEGADLRGADLRGAFLEGVDLSGARMDKATLLDPPVETQP